MNEEAIRALHAYLRAVVGDEPSPLRDHVDDVAASASAMLATASLATAGEVLASSALSALAVETKASPQLESRLVREDANACSLIREILGEAHRLTGAEPTRVALLALEDPAPIAVPLNIALRAHVTLLGGTSGARGIAVWRLGTDGEPALSAYALDGDPYSTRLSVTRALNGGAESAIVIRAFDEPCAVLAWTAGYSSNDIVREIARRSARMLGLAFERASLLDGTLVQRSALARSAERRLTRIAFDLHDGAMQDIAILCGELKLLRSTLRDETSGPKRDPEALVEDALAIAEAVNTDLRELAHSMESSKMVERPFKDAMARLTQAFALRSGIEPEVTVEGDVSNLTPTARMTLLRVIGEALSNVREHSEATEAKVAVRAGNETIEASVHDNGIGFDVNAALPAAARRGSLGLLGMTERMRLVDGTCRIYSQTGIGTTVTLAFERYVPQAEGSDGTAAPVPASGLSAAPPLEPARPVLKPVPATPELPRAQSA